MFRSTFTKIPSNSDNKLWGLFLVKAPFRKKFQGGGLIFGGGSLPVYMDEYLHFENAFFVHAIVFFLKFSAYNMSLLLIFFTFLFLIMYLQLSIPHCIVNKISTP